MKIFKNLVLMTMYVVVVEIVRIVQRSWNCLRNYL